MEQSKSTKELKNQYQREWRARNKDKVKGYNEKYWSKRLDEMQKAAATAATDK